MDKESWIRPRRRLRRHVSRERFNRDDHWTRSFNVRFEPWPTVEHWAAEFGYHMIAFKGKRRLYQKGFNAKLYLTFVDIKQSEGSLHVSAWIQVGWVLRLLTLFALPSELPVDPSGYLSIIKRRHTCQEMNSLLERFRQVPIIGSQNFHVADLDPTTLLLLGLFVLPVIAFVYGAGSQIEIRMGLSNPLLIAMGRQLGILAGIGLGLVLLHHFVSVKQLKRLLWKGISTGVLTLLFLLASILLLTKTSTEMLETKITFYCVYRSNSETCRKILDGLDPRARAAVRDRLQFLEKELSRGETKPH